MRWENGHSSMHDVVADVKLIVTSAKEDVVVIVV